MLLLSFPDEILVRVFVELDGYGLMRSQEVCVSFRKIVTDDIRLQYKLKLYASSMIDRPHSFTSMPISERLSTLNSFLAARGSWTHAWPEGMVKQADLNVLPGGGGFVYRSKMLVGWLDLQTIVSLKFLNRNSPFPYSKRVFHPHAVDNSRGLLFDPTQALLVLMGESLKQGGGRDYGVHIRSLSNGGHHPRAQQSFISTSAWIHEFGYSAEINDELIAISGHGFGDGSTRAFVVLNWLTGNVEWNSELPHGPVTFLDKKHFLIGTKNIHTNRIELRVYAQGRQEPLLVFPFPELESSIILPSGLRLNITHNYTRSPNAPTAEVSHLPFGTDVSKRVLALTMWVDGEMGSERRIYTIFPASAIISFITDSPRPCREIPWGDWPQCTISMPLGKPKISVYGSRVAILRSNLFSRIGTISVYDLNERWFAKQMRTEVTSFGRYFKASLWEHAIQTIPLPQPEQVFQSADLEEFWMDEDMLIASKRGPSVEYVRL
ncbi:hypothetical protein BDN72DRAFT_964189 [Pluteus cervinus]|uniref:Uncharacterized protein n=1 Tax=Pluteus cervinus TaxID=181527 RepID=A0ACD3ACA8_9AGAR|nr:hypothetical protein BDN72DRAFT_964189 [Pluteus cervinus]